MDKVTVVITTYKRKEEFRKALISVINQTYDNIEIIVVDDNIENTYIVYVQQILEKYDNVKYIKNKKNLGGALSRNVGLKASTGKYIAFLDDDDVYFDKKIENQVKCFEESDVCNLGIVYCHTEAVDVYENILEKYEKNVRGDFLLENMLGTIAATTQWLCLKSAVEQVGGFKDVPSKQDTTLLLDLAMAGYRIDVVPQILTKYYELDIERISGVSEKNLKGELLLRDYMRRIYNRFNYKNIRTVEYNIDFRIYYLQIRLGKYKEAFQTLKLLYKTHINRLNVLIIIIKHPFRRFRKERLK